MEKDHTHNNGENYDLMTSSETSSIDNLLLKNYKQTVHDLQNHKMLLERAESIGHIGYWEYDVNSDRVWASNGARLIYGFDKGELSLNNIQKIVFPEFRTILNQKLENLIHENDKYDVEFKIYRQNDGAIKHIRSHAEFSKTENKVHGIIQDISLQKKTELELIEARYRAEESDRLKSAFVSNMSHEIRTPMNGIVGYAHLLAEKELDIDTRLEYKENIHKCCNQLIDKVNDILDIAKIESGQIVVNTGGVELNKLLNDVLGCFMQQVEVKKLELILNTENVKNELTILTDEVKLRKIIINLIDNAVRFTQSGYIEFGYRVKDAEIEFYVKDTGLGIDPSHYEIIFQPFCQANSQISTEYGGNGLGLSIAQTYVSMLGGKIWLESQLGAGTTFFFTLPNSDISKQSVTILRTRKKFSQPKLSLIVEDMEMNYNYLKVLLEHLGFRVLWAKDGNEAIDIALKNIDIDLVLMDIRLPGTDGYQATRIIKEMRPDLPIIAQTANALLNEREKALESGCNEYITKPIYKDELEKILRTFFDS